jgi:thymidylate synthase (FAD)
MEVSLQAVTPNAEEQIVEIARVSSKREDKKENPAPLIGYLIKNHHWSPFEHGFMTLKIVTTKAIGIQLLRHRSFTFQELSQRYAVVGEREPIELRGQHVDNRQSSTDVFDPMITIGGKLDGSNPEQEKASELVDEYLDWGQRLYTQLLEAGVARECARMILPMSTQTTIYMSGPVRSWIHMIQLRDDGHAQKEAQEIAREMKQIFREQFPIITEALEWNK